MRSRCKSAGYGVTGGKERDGFIGNKRKIKKFLWKVRYISYPAV